MRNLGRPLPYPVIQSELCEFFAQRGLAPAFPIAHLLVVVIAMGRAKAKRRRKAKGVSRLAAITQRLPNMKILTYAEA